MWRWILATKYWLSGDSWEFAWQYAGAIVYGFKRLSSPTKSPKTPEASSTTSDNDPYRQSPR